MISISYLFENPNVQSEHPSGLVAPFGSYNPRKDNDDRLAKLQDLNKFSPDQQTKRLRDVGVNINDFM